MHIDEDFQNNENLIHLLPLIKDKSLKKKLTELCKNYELECNNEYYN